MQDLESRGLDSRPADRDSRRLHTVHIAATAATTGILALSVFALLGRQQGRLFESALIGVLSAAAVLLWRKSANMPQLNNDGLNGFSANDGSPRRSPSSRSACTETFACFRTSTVRSGTGSGDDHRAHRQRRHDLSPASGGTVS